MLKIEIEKKSIKKNPEKSNLNQPRLTCQTRNSGYVTRITL
jgi:hypothetical protein